MPFGVAGKEFVKSISKFSLGYPKSNFLSGVLGFSGPIAQKMINEQAEFERKAANEQIVLERKQIAFERKVANEQAEFERKQIAFENKAMNEQIAFDSMQTVKKNRIRSVG